MTVLLVGSQLRQINLGQIVNRATATLPQTAAGNIFTITGGRILLTSIVGEVTTIIQNQANVTKLQAVPTVGTTVDLTATADIANLEVGGKLGLILPIGTALSKQTAGAVAIQISPIIIAVGSIALNCGASNTGSVKWSMTYIPYDDNATVAAA